MSLFYESLSKKTAMAFKARKKAFKKNKPCAICGQKFAPEYMMVAHIKPVRELDDFDALYDTSNWEVRCIGCERELTRQEHENARKD